MRSFYSPTREFKCPFKFPKIFVGKEDCKACKFYIGQSQWTVYCKNDCPANMEVKFMRV